MCLRHPWQHSRMSYAVQNGSTQSLAQGLATFFLPPQQLICGPDFYDANEGPSSMSMWGLRTLLAPACACQRQHAQCVLQPSWLLWT